MSTVLCFYTSYYYLTFILLGYEPLHLISAILVWENVNVLHKCKTNPVPMLRHPRLVTGAIKWNRAICVGSLWKHSLKDTKVVKTEILGEGSFFFALYKKKYIYHCRKTLIQKEKRRRRRRKKKKN